MMSNRLASALLGVLLAGTAIPAALTTLPLATPARAQSGASYTLRRVTFVGNAQVPSAELQAALPYQAGQTIDHDALQANMDAISGVYRRHNVGANISQRMTATGHAATITYTFAEQAPVAPTVTHVGITADTVTASGNSRIKTADILAASGIRPGGPVTTQSIQAAQTAIVALYKKANIGSTVSSDWTNAAQPQHVNLVFRIVEKPDS